MMPFPRPRWPRSVAALVSLAYLATALPLAALLAYHIYREANAEIGKANLTVRSLASITVVETVAALAEYERLLAVLAARRDIRALDPAWCDSGFNSVIELHRSVINVATSNLQGDVVCSTLKAADGRRTNIGNTGWFAELKRRNAFVISAPQKGIFTGRWVVVLSYPLRDTAGKMFGSVGVAVNISTFQPLITATLPAAALAGILDRDANVIAGSFRPDEVVGTNLQGAGISPLILEREEGTVIGTGRDGAQRVYAFKPVGASGWFAVVGVPTESIYAEARRLAWQSVLTGLAFLLVSFMLVWLIHRRISLPLAALTAATEEIAAGRFDLRVPEGGPREVVQVAHGVNRALGQLQNSEARFRALTSLASEWYWETDEEHRFTVVSAGGNSESVGGVDPARFIGSTRWEREDDLTAPADMARYRGILERREAFREFEFARRGVAGKAQHALVGGEPVFDAGGKFTGYRGVGRSITARREVEARLRDSERHYRTLVDASPDAIRVVCEDRIVMLNPAGLRMYGADVAVSWPIGALVADTIPSEFREIALERIRKVIEERIAAPVSEQTLIRADGSTIPLEVRTIPFEYEGKPAALTILHDITGRKAAERAVAQVNASLEERVEKRTLELSQANKDLEAFSYTVAHDLRAPLRSISGFAALLGETKSQNMDAEARTFLDRIKTSVASMSQLIEGLLSLARLGRVQLRPVKVDLSALVDHVAAELQQRGPARAVEWVIQPGVTAVGDLHLVKDVLENLLGNGWKFSSGRELARVEFGSVAHEAGVAYFVRDNGAGFDPAYANKLFGTFQRLHSVGEFPGIGIGLASVKSIVETHGGKVWAEGAVGAGATFWFTLGPRDQASWHDGNQAA